MAVERIGDVMKEKAGEKARAARGPAKQTVSMFHAESRRLQALFERIATVAPFTPCSGEPQAGLKSVILCMTPRSGSSYIGSALGMNKIGRFGEHFRVVGGSLEKAVEESGAKSYEDFVRSRIDAFKVRDFFGAKADWMQFAPIYHFGAYDRYFKDARYIYLTRTDILMQAISRYIGTQTGYFHSVNTDREGTRKDEVPFDFDELWRHVDHLIDMQAAWEHFFASEGIAPLRITYEEIDADPTDVLKRISAFIDFPLPDPIVIDTAYKKVRNERNEKMKAMAIEEVRRRRLSTTPAVAPADAPAK